MGALTDTYNDILSWLNRPLFDPDDRATYILEQHAALAALEDRRNACLANPEACDLTANEYVDTKNRLESNISFHEEYINNWDLYGSIIESVALSAGGAAIGIVKKGLPASANFAQKTYNKFFSDEGREIYSKLAGYSIKTIDDLANAIIKGDVSVSDIKVQTIVRDGKTLILNTRTMQALERAGIKRSDIEVQDVTGDEFFEDLLTNQLSRNKLSSDGVSSVRQSFSECFASGTHVAIWCGKSKTIETICVGDIVTSYDADGNLVPGRVVRTFKNEVSHLLDVHGLKVTPGHVTLCGDGRFAGRHIPIIDILLSDGALVRECGELIRMSTNKPVGDLEDQMVEVSYAETSEDLHAGKLKSGQMRVGTLLFDKDGVAVSVLDCIRSQGLEFDVATGLVSADGSSATPLNWFGPLPRPQDYILRRSRETLEDILTSGEWEGSPSELIAGRLKQTAERYH